MSHKRIIKISANRIYLNETFFFELINTNIPDDSLKFRSFEDFYWEVDVLEFNTDTKALVFEVSNFHPDNIKSFKTQNVKSGIQKVVFKPMRWKELYPFLSMYQKSLLIPQIIQEENETLVMRESKTNSHPATEMFELEDSEILPIETEEKEETYKVNFEVYFKDAEFNLGYVSIWEIFEFYDLPIKLNIYNSFVLPEFNYIKSYFPKVFKGKKKFSVKATIIIKGVNILKIKAFSKEISQIDEKVIDTLKYLRTKELSKFEPTEKITKSLFTSDEFFASFEDLGDDGNVFNQDEEELLNFFIKYSAVRNRKQLEYLAGLKHINDFKIHFTFKPIFGFLFLIEGQSMNHFCWELLNSHATYLWSFARDESTTNDQFKIVEEMISLIRDNGREKYKNAYRKNNLHWEVVFNSIHHKDVGSKVKDGFVEWKYKLKEKLV